MYSSAKAWTSGELNFGTSDKALEALNDIEDKISEGDIVYIKGSQGARMERIVEKLMQNPEQKEQLLVRQEEEWQHR